VTLRDGFSIWSPSRYLAGANSQGTDAKHEGHAQLLLPLEVHRADLKEWQDQHPGEDVDVDTRAIVLLIPLCPKVADRRAQEDGSDNEGDPVEHAEDDGQDNRDLDGRILEDAEEEDEDGELQEGDGAEVKDLHDVKPAAKGSQVVGTEYPNVLAEAIFLEAHVVEDGDGEDDGRREHDADVVPLDG
jgi:hypothetical protein